MEKILISSCLVGDKTKYNGKSNYTPLVKKLLEYYELVPFCCEVEGGLFVPRPPAEIQSDGTVKNENGHDVTRFYEKGAEKGLGICKYLGIRYAILKEKSPACGVHCVYDGTFTHTLTSGQGILTAKLVKAGIQVFNEDEIEDFLEKTNHVKKNEEKVAE